MKLLWLLPAVIALVLTASSPQVASVQSLFGLELAAKQGHRDAMLALAERYQQQNKRSAARHWVQQALYAGHPDALPLLLDWYPQHERQWLRLAAQYGHPTGRVFYWLENNTPPSDVKLTPAQVKQLLPFGRTVLARYSLRHDAPPHLPHWRALAPAVPVWQERVQGDEVLRALPAQCDFSLRFYTEQPQPLGLLSWLAELENFFSKRGYRLCASKHPLTMDLPCLAEKGRAYCALALPKEQPVPVIVTSEGEANTRNGVIYINERAHWRVLLHELGHALGLADEYAMAQPLAQNFCAGKYDFTARNLVLVEPRLYTERFIGGLKQQIPWQAELSTNIAQPIKIQNGEYFRLGSNEPEQVGLFPASTCNSTRTQAWKPFARQTFMEYHHAQFVPDLYLQWMAEAMAQRQ